MNQMAQIYAAVEFLKGKIPPHFVTLGLGSGYDGLISMLDDLVEIPYESIPFFPVWHDPQAQGKLVSGLLGNTPVVIFTKRFQYCYGYTSDQMAFPLRVLNKLGSKFTVLTNAAGGINSQYAVGDFVVITDHIDFTARNPLIGENPEEFGPRFPDMSEIYSHRLAHSCIQAANEIGIPIHTGVYAGVTGPSYETPAEIKAFRILGADLVGMSTVPETIILRHMGQSVLAISTVTNQAAGNTPLLLSHEDVLIVSKRRTESMIKLLRSTLDRC
jgi:purine-nucleoside phosphorylase